ncbi:putative nicotinamide N-methyase [Kineococcus xinjiangensis]|uniref:Putative nicotinamide N-methyase n=1 Tax=Kineococcus xinjiangensis TaxID=512762 RepID=A0A2S6IVJ2_9ACTN|nr:50S ribosomal protein L11 methyltransferase [Kineococcus xinjiangensis]PPK98173.1 putative nicotinamide N-methyase [Kineococcus xinjiangensis]
MTTTPGADAMRDFVLAGTRPVRPELVPELRLLLAEDTTALWQQVEERFGRSGTEPPFWAAAWAGGQAVARYLLDHPTVVAGRSVLDLASGSGLCAVAAATAGAARVLAVDVDEFSAVAVRENAALNDVAVEVLVADLLGGDPPAVDLVIAGDVWYERRMAERFLAWLHRCRDAGLDVLVGDPGRAFLPRRALVEVARYGIAADPSLESAAVRHAVVFRLR